MDGKKETEIGTNNKTDTNGDGKKIFKKVIASKVDKKQRRRRQNARFRKLLMPKNALMVIHELYPDMKCEIQEQLNALCQPVFTATLTVGVKQYQGQGTSKNGSKVAACEKALKSILLNKIGKSARQAAAGGGGGDDATSSLGLNFGCPASLAVDESGDSKMDEGEAQGEDDVPWSSLASFAMHKLLMDCGNQSHQPNPPSTAVFPNFIPLLTPRCVPPVSVSPQVAAFRPRKKLPENPTKCNPVELMNQLKPGAVYTVQDAGTPPVASFLVTVKLDDGQTFSGVAKSKKEAKRLCAKTALLGLGIIQDEVDSIITDANKLSLNKN